MGLWRGDPRLRRERRIEFLGEKDGETERVLKSALLVALRRHPRIARAYLARVGFSPRSQPAVALCLFPSAAESSAVVDEVERAFAQIFAEGVELDILFPSEAEEEDLRRVCHTFFERTPE